MVRSSFLLLCLFASAGVGVVVSNACAPGTGVGDDGDGDDGDGDRDGDGDGDGGGDGDGDERSGGTRPRPDRTYDVPDADPCAAFAACEECIADPDASCAWTNVNNAFECRTECVADCFTDSCPIVPPYDDGFPCFTDIECVSGFCNGVDNVCAPSFCSEGDACGTGQGCDLASNTCVYVEDCSVDSDCPDGTVCSRHGDPLGSCGAFCAPPVSEGDSCSFSTDTRGCDEFATACAAGLECARHGNDIFVGATCVAGLDVGAPCASFSTQNDGCAAPLICELTQLTDFLDGTCQPAALAGETCAVDIGADATFRRACADGLLCTLVTIDDGETLEIACEA